MRKIIYLFIFATVLLIVKAFFLDDYIARYKNGDANGSTEMNASTESIQSVPESKEKNSSALKSDTKSVQEEKKLPLDQLGDDLTKHIKL